MCRHMYDWNTVKYDVKQPIQLNSTEREYIKRSVDFWSSDLLSRTLIQTHWYTARL